VLVTAALMRFVLGSLSATCAPLTDAQTVLRYPASMPFSYDLTFWDTAGQAFHASNTLPSATTEGMTHWVLPTTHPTGATLTITATPTATGVLSVHLAPPVGTQAVAICLPTAGDEHFYGLGERFGRLDLVGQLMANWSADHAFTSDPSTSYSPVPFLLSSRGYGLLVETTAYATFDLRHTLSGRYCICVATGTLTLTRIAGPHPHTILERYTAMVGRPPLPPRWAFGVWKNVIGGPERVEQEVARLRAAGIPLDAVWIYDAVDERAIMGWPWQVYRPVASGQYPDLRGLIARLHAQQLKVLGYLNNFVYAGSEAFADAARHGYLLQTPHGQPYVEPWAFAPRAWVDFTNPAATAWWQARVTSALTDVGFDGAMLDFGEAPPLAARYANGLPGAVLHNQYPVFYHRAAHRAGQAAKPQDVVFLARAGYSGSQRYTTGRFTGDQERSWDAQRGLPSVLAGMLNGSLSGWPYWGLDIGGFYEPGPLPADESAAARAHRLGAEKELWIRWVQLGALSPTMRDMLGAQTDPVTLWTDEETLEVFRLYARLHTALKPYLYHYASLAHTRGLPILRPLFFNYPDDSVTYTLHDEYLVGDDLLVAPVLAPGQTARTLYLPTGAWCHYWTGNLYTGPGWVTAPAPLHQIPLFLRAGATLQLPARVHVTAQPTSDSDFSPARCAP
jgi:alpha-D-xyloside xylohydrolase